MPQEFVSTYYIDIKKKVSIEMTTQGFLMSEKADIIKNSKEQGIDEIALKDAKGGESKLKFNLIKDRSCLFSYVVYAEAIVINETPLKLDIFSFLDGEKKNTKRLAG